MYSRTKPMEVRHETPTPSTVMIVGPTGCGKTDLVFKILLLDQVFLPVPTRIKYYYGAWQTRFAGVEAADPRLEFADWLPVYEDLPGGSEHTVMVITGI